MTDNEKIILHDDGWGIARLSGADEDGAPWQQFEVDVFAEQEPGTCFLCGAELLSGWVHVDGGEECCDEHVLFIPAKGGNRA